MAQGNTKIAQSLMELQPTAVVEFFLIYPDTLNYPTIEIPIHAGSLYDRPITWQGKTYTPVAVEVEGFEQNANSQLSRPTIKIANKDYLVTSLLQNYEDLKNAEIVRKRTFVKYLDDVNFDGGNPFGTADSSAEIGADRYVVGQKTAENKIYVELELASPLDLENFEVNHRRILGKYCYWQYRGAGCNYEGIPIQRADGKPFTNADGEYVVPTVTGYSNRNPSFSWAPTITYAVSDCVYMENDKVLIHALNNEEAPRPVRSWYVAVAESSGQRPDLNPSYWQKDGCNKKLSSCRLRFSDTSSVAYQQSSQTKSYDAVNFQGSYEAGSPTGQQITIDPTITSAFLNQDFTVALWVTPTINQTDFWGVIQTSPTRPESDPFAFQLYGRRHDTRVYCMYSDDSFLSFEMPFDEPSLVLIERDYTNNKFRIFHNDVSQPAAEGTPGTTHQFEASEFSLGMNNWYDSLNRPANGDFGPCAIWDRQLTLKEKDGLIRTDTNGVIAPRLYADMTGTTTEGIKNGLIAWWETTGVVGTLPKGFLDSHTNGLDMSGTGIINSSDDDTYTLDIPFTAFRKEKVSILPFGGFPGTDGFSYEA